MNNFLDVNNIVKFHKGETGSKLLVLDNVSFSINENDIITSILAPAGSGKSTLLKIISGIDFEFDGGILLKGNKVVNKIPFIPEKPSSFPWLNVEGNIKLVFKILDEMGSDVKFKLPELIDITGLSGYEKHFPYKHSFGFRFRISLARAIAVSPEIILLDDPFKLVDNETKEELTQMIKRISGEKGIRFLVAASNITDAFNLSDKIILLSKLPVSVISDISVDKNDVKSFIAKNDATQLANFSI